MASSIKHTKYANPGTRKSLNPMSRLSEVNTSRFIISSSENPQFLSRYFGGNRRENHPYISGYWYFLIQPPSRLFDSGENNSSNNRNSVIEWLFATAESFTPPGKTLTFVDVPGMGGLNSSYVAGQELTQTFSVTFREYQEMPIFNIMQTWTSMIDLSTGVSPLAGDEYIPANYKGTAFVALCKPTVGSRSGTNDAKICEEDIEQLFFFDGVFPEATPFDSLDSDISTNDTKTISVSFSFDGFPLLKDSPGVVTEFIKLANEKDAWNIDNTYNHVLNDQLNGIESSTRSGT